MEHEPSARFERCDEDLDTNPLDAEIDRNATTEHPRLIVADGQWLDERHERRRRRLGRPQRGKRQEGDRYERQDQPSEQESH